GLFLDDRSNGERTANATWSRRIADGRLHRCDWRLYYLRLFGQLLLDLSPITPVIVGTGDAVVRAGIERLRMRCWLIDRIDIAHTRPAHGLLPGNAPVFAYKQPTVRAIEDHTGVNAPTFRAIGN